MHVFLQAKVGGDTPASTEAADAVAREEADARSVYVGSVDYGCTPEELQLHFQVR
jgi:polyadenylate-binding protein 2